MGMRRGVILLPPPSLPELMAARTLALFLDFDGTLVEIAETPDGIVVPDSLADGLLALRDRLEGRLAVVTGRALDNLEKHLGDVPLFRAGAHGAQRVDERGAPIGSRPSELPPRARKALHDFAKTNGLTCEDKGSGIAVHYRNREDCAEPLLALARETARGVGGKVTHGKCVVEVTSMGADKGSAVEAILQLPAFADAMPVFIGDDVTDEDGFAAAEAHGGFGIHVGSREPQGARYKLDSVAAVHHWLGL